MEKIEKRVGAGEERKSEKYKSFPNVSEASWGENTRKNHPDHLHDAIMGRIRHLSSRIDSYLPYPPGGKNQYGVDQSIAVDLENSFDELAQSYLKCAKESYGGSLFPKDDKGSYSWETIQKFDKKLEEIHSLIINAEDPLFKEKEGKILEDGDAQLNKAKYRDYSNEEKKVLHEQGVEMLKDAIGKIKSLKELLESKTLLNS